MSQATVDRGTGLDLNGTVGLAWIDYDGASELLQVFLADDEIKPETAALSATVALADVVGEQAYVGFTGSTTRRDFDTQDLLDWRFDSDSVFIA